MNYQRLHHLQHIPCWFRTPMLALTAALAAGCGGGGGGDGPSSGAVSWSVVLGDHPTGSCFRPDTLVPLVVTASSAAGPISQPMYSVTADPAAGLTTDGMGRVTVRGEGPLRLTFTYQGERAAGAILAPQILNLMRDGTAPRISVTSPQRAAFLVTAGNDEAVSIQGAIVDDLSPVKAVYVNDSAMAVGGQSLSETLAVQRPAHWGTNFIKVSAADACGNTAQHAQSFLQSTRYLPAAQTRLPSARVPSASAMRFAVGVIDDLNRADFDDFATISERMLQKQFVPMLNAGLAQMPPVVRTGSVNLGIGSGTCIVSADPQSGASIAAGSPTLEINLAQGALGVYAELRRLVIPVTYKAECTGLLGNVFFSETGTFNHAADSIAGSINVMPRAVAGALELPSAVDLSLSGFSVDSSDRPALANIVNAAAPGLTALIQSLLDNVLEDVVADQVSSSFESLFDSIAQIRTIPLAPPLSLVLHTGIEWRAIDVTPQALTLVLDHYIYPDSAGSPFASIGAINAGLPVRPLQGSAGTWMAAVSDDAANQLLWALWYGGALELPHLETYAAALPNLAEDAQGLVLNLSARMAPVIERGTDAHRAVFGIGDVHVTGSLDLDSSPLFSGSGIVSFDLYAGLRTDGRSGVDLERSQLNVRLDDFGRQFYLHINSLQFGGQALEDAVLADQLHDQLARVLELVLQQLLGGTSAALPLPPLTIDFPAALVGTNSSLLLDPLYLQRDTDRFVVAIDPDDALHPTVQVNNWSALGAVALDAAREDARLWLEGVRLSCLITRDIAHGPAVWDTTYRPGDRVKAALLQAGAPESIARDWNRIFKSAWLQWGDGLYIPDLPWFPEFAADAISGDIRTVDATTGSQGTLTSGGINGLSAASLRGALEFRLMDYLNQPGASAAIAAFADGFAERFNQQQQQGSIPDVRGTTVYPDFALWTGVLVVGAIIAYVDLETLADLLSEANGELLSLLWPPPPLTGPRIGACLQAGRLDSAGFQ